MSTKLTLSIDEQTIIKAKLWAKSHHTSLSGLVEKYFKTLTKSSDNTQALATKTKSINGLFNQYNENLSYKELVNKYKVSVWR